MTEWTKEDFLNGTGPYEEICAIEDPFIRQQQVEVMAAAAKELKIYGFKKLLDAYSKTVEDSPVVVERTTAFSNQPMELDCGKWQADDFGVYEEDLYGNRRYACPHPVLPVERLVNVDTGEERTKLAYRKGNSPWRTIIVENTVLASASKVTELAGRGISVTSENAKHFIRYIFDLETLNYDRLDERKSIGRLGYIPGFGFSPYVDGLVFDGNASFKSLYDAVTPRGTFDNDTEDCWMFAARWARRSSLTARIMLAASFASPLLSVLGALPFFVHLWGVDSGTGKTVALMLAASVWGNPAIGAYIKTFHSTNVGNEYTAAFLNHLPLCLDELQLSKDSHGRSNFDVYKLAEGVGKTRGNKYGGVDATPTWANAILTTGESPLTGSSAGAGAVNRVLDIECTTGSPAVPDGCGMWLSGLLKRHYGHAGRRFVDELYRCRENQGQARQFYEAYFRQLNSRDTTEKQAMAAAMVLTADRLLCGWLMPGEEPTTVEEIAGFLASKAAASAGERGYDFVVSWIAMNKGRFLYTADTPEVWGRIDEDPVHGSLCYVVSAKLRQALENEGFSPNAVLSWMLSKGKIPQVDRDKKTVCTQRINSIPTKCVCVRID